MRIGDAAAATGLTPRALRFYEEEGLLRPRRAPSGHRQYTEGDLRLLRAVRELLGAGLTIADVRSFAHILADDPASAPATGPGPGPGPGTGAGPGTGIGAGAGPDPGAGPAPAPDPAPGTEYCAVGRVSAERLAELDARIAQLTAVRERLASRMATRFGSLFEGRTPAGDPLRPCQPPGHLPSGPTPRPRRPAPG